MRIACALVGLLAGCGRVGFEPHAAIAASTRDGPTGARCLAAASTHGGECLSRVAPPGWSLTREAQINNGSGVTFDPDGAFDGIGVAAIYINKGNQGIARRTDATGGTATVW